MSLRHAARATHWHNSRVRAVTMLRRAVLACVACAALASTQAAAAAAMAAQQQTAVSGDDAATLRILVGGVPLPPPGANASSSPVLQWLQQQDWAWGVTTSYENRQPPTRGQLETIWGTGLVPVTVLHASNVTRSRQAKAHSAPVPDVTATFTDVLAAATAAGKPASDVVWKAFEEDDSSGVGFPWELQGARVNTSAEAFDAWQGHLAEATGEAAPWVSKGVDLWGRIGFPSSTHALARAGVRTVLVERANDDVGDLLPAIAFARGAAAQFSDADAQGAAAAATTPESAAPQRQGTQSPTRHWGIDLSLWWGAIQGCVSQFPAHFHRRHLYATHAAGAHVLEYEGCGWKNDTTGEWLPLVQELASFGIYSQHEGFEAMGVPDVPVGVVLPVDHGWLVPPYWATSTELVYWNYARLTRPQGARGLDGLFGAAWPGAGFGPQPWPWGNFANDSVPSPFALDYVEPQWAPRASDVFAAQPPLDFGVFATRKDASQWLQAAQLDTSPFRPMGDTRWGDVINVLTDDATLTALCRYPLLVLAGPVNVTDNLEARLTAYVKAGGTLVWAVGVARPHHSLLTGVAFTGEMRAGRAWVWHGLDGAASTAGGTRGDGSGAATASAAAATPEPFLYSIAHSVSDGANVTVVASTPAGAPLIVRHSPNGVRQTAGAVYTVMLPWFEGAPASGGTSLGGPALALLDATVSALQPVVVSGLPVQYHSTTVWDAVGESPLARTVTVVNNDGDVWTGTLTMRGLIASVESESAVCKDVLTGDVVPASLEGADVVVSVVVDAYDVRVVRCARADPT